MEELTVQSTEVAKTDGFETIEYEVDLEAAHGICDENAGF